MRAKNGPSLIKLTKKYVLFRTAKVNLALPENILDTLNVDGKKMKSKPASCTLRPFPTWLLSESWKVKMDKSGAG